MDMVIGYLDGCKGVNVRTARNCCDILLVCKKEEAIAEAWKLWHLMPDVNVIDIMNGRTGEIVAVI